jgi:hypothetical protein
MFHLGVYTFTSTFHRLLHLPLWVSAIGRIRNSQSSIVGAGLSLGENHFPTDSLTWRELLTGLKPASSTTGLATHFFNQFSTQFPQGKDNNNNNNIHG